MVRFNSEIKRNGGTDHSGVTWDGEKDTAATDTKGEYIADSKAVHNKYFLKGAKKMKKIAKKVLLLCMAMAMAAGMATTALAVETVKINGYPGSALNDLITAEYQISISNVIKKEAATYLEYADTYICQGPVTVTALDDMEGFYGYTLVKKDGTYDWGDELSISGDVKFYSDGSTRKHEQGAEWTYMEGFEFKKGATITIAKPGIYNVAGRYSAIDGGAFAVIVVQDEGKATATPAPTAAVKATPTSSTVIVNGTATAFEAYTINGNNYFKLRDVAKVISGSDKQFEVLWDDSKNAISLISERTYTAVGGELAKGDGTPKNAVSTSSTVYKNGVVIALTAYTINGNNYFKLRDLGQSFDFGVSWDAANNAVMVDTAQGYTAE